MVCKFEDIDYIVMNHTEPDHSGSIEKLIELYPNIKIVGSSAAINFMKEITNREFNSIVVKDGDTLSLGNKTLKFISAPNLHWPDTIFTYVPEDKLLFTCDVFGAHYSIEEITNDKITNRDDYLKALRYYFDMIIGPFKSFAKDAIKKIDALEIEMILTGHGPVLSTNPMEIVEIYKEWTKDPKPNEKKTVVIPYVSAYGYTEMLAFKITEGIKAAGDIEVKLFNLNDPNISHLFHEIHYADGLLFGTPTMVGEALKPIWELTINMHAKTHGGKIASAFGSYGWSGEGVPNIIQRLKQLNMKVYEEGYKVKFKPSEDQLKGAFEFGYNFGKSVIAGKIVEFEKFGETVKAWKCLVCGEIVPGDNAPAKCPVCGVPADQFILVEIDKAGFLSNEKTKILIIGNGAAGVSAAAAIRARNTNCNIEIISDEAVIGYNRPMLTKGLISKIESSNFDIKPESWYKDNNIKISLSMNAIKIDKQAKEITLNTGDKVAYDKLIIATGARAQNLGIVGQELAGVFSIRNLKDVTEIQEMLSNVQDVVILGSGVLGIEAAWELKKANKNVTIVDRSGIIMSKQLDSKGSQILEEAIIKSDIKVVHNAKIDSIVSEGNKIIDGKAAASHVKLSDGTLLAADLVIISMGISPNIELAKDAGLEIGKFIIVNDMMGTNDDSIFACGDCAEYKGQSYGIWIQSIEMGKVAGANAAGDKLIYKQIIPMNSFNGVGTSLFSVGDNGKDESKKYKMVEVIDEAKNTYEKMYFVNEKLVGAILIGDTKKAVRLSKAYENGESLSKIMVE
jgi:flavorubredoxin/NADPH-dependent 2,4-dienoyl-CoA reductase/sulfur reductase-like enzyme